MKIFIQKTLVLLFLSLLTLTQVIAQNNFKSEDDLKKQADKLFEEQQYAEALPLFSQLLSLYQKDPMYNYKYGTCMLYATEDKEKPLMYLGFAANKPNVDNEVFYHYGRALQLNYRFEEALNAYNSFKKNASAKSITSSQVDLFIENCNNGKELLSSITKLQVLDKKDLKEADFFISYDLGDLGGKLVVKPEDFLTAIDTKKQDKSLMFIMPGAGEYYFSSYGESEKNSRDIYKVVKLPSGEFSKPINLGSVINTNKDEDYPFMHPNGKTLYFCSKGHNSMGGYDIFRSDWDANTSTWSNPVNLDFAINSPDDDIMFITNKESSLAYFASKRSNVTGRTHIYKIKHEEKKEDILLVSGKLMLPPGSDLNASIQVKDINNKRKIIGTYRSNPKTGIYVISVPNGGNIELVVDVPKYSTLTRQIDIPKLDNFGKTLKQEITQNANDATSLVLNNKFDEAATEEDRNAALAFIKESASLDVNFDPAIEAINSKADSLANESNNNAVTENNNTSDKNASNVESNGADAVVANNQNGVSNNQTVNDKNSAVSDTAKSSATGLSENELVNIAYEDAKESQAEANEIKNEAVIARQVANKKQQNLSETKDLLAIAKTKESIEQDPAKKQEAQNLVNQLQTKINSLETQVQLTDGFATKLEQNAAKKQADAEADLKYANELETAVKSNTDKSAIAKLAEQRKQIEETQGDYSAEGQYEEVRDALAAKQTEINTNQERISTLNKDLQDLESEKTQLTQEQGKTKDKTVKQTLSNQIAEIDTEQKTKRDNLLAAENKSKLLKLQYDSLNKQVEIVNDLVAEIKSGAPATNSNELAVTNNNATNTNITTQTENQTISSVSPPQFNAITLSSDITPEAKNIITQKAYLKEIDKTIKANNANTDAVAQAQANQKTYGELVSAIETDVNITRQQIESSTDEKEKSNLTAVVTELEKIKSNAQSELAKSNNTLASANIPANTNNSTNSIVNQPSSYNNEYYVELNKAEAISDDKEKEETKKKINETWLAKINTETEETKAKLSGASEADKPVLQEKLKDLAIAANERKQAIKRNEEKINQLSPVVQNTDKTNNVSTDANTAVDTGLTANKNVNPNNAIANNSQGANNEVATNNATNAPVNNDAAVNAANISKQPNVFTTENKAVGVFPENSIYNGVNYTSQSAAQSLMLFGPGQKKSDQLQKEIDSLRVVLGTTTNEEEKKTLEQTIAQKQQKFTETNILLAEVVGEANKRQYEDQKQELAKLQAANANNANDQAVMAGLVNDEADYFYKEARTIREQVKTIENPVDKESALTRAYDMEKRAFEKQQKAYELYSKASQNYVADNTQPLANANNNSNQTNAVPGNNQAANTTQVAGIDTQNNNSAVSNNNTTNLTDTLLANNVNNNAKQTNNVAENTNANPLTTENLNTAQAVSNNNQSDAIIKAKIDSIKITPVYASFDSLNTKAKLEKDTTERVKSNYNESINEFNKQLKQTNALQAQFDTTTNETEKQKLNEQLVAENKRTDSLKSQMQENRQLYEAQKIEQEKSNALVDSFLVKLSDEQRKDVMLAYNGPAKNGNDNSLALNNVSPTPDVQNIGPANGNKQAAVTPDIQNIGPAGNKQSDTTPTVQNIGPATDKNTMASANNIQASASQPVIATKAVSTPTKVEIKNNKIILPKTFDEVNMFFEKAEKAAYSSNNPIPIDVNIPEGLIFKVQIGAFRNPIPQDLFKGFNPVTGERTSTGVIRYTAGFFKKFAIADEAKREIQSMGYRDAFVVAFYNGKRISMNEAMAMSKETPMAANNNPVTNNSTVNNTEVKLPENTPVNETNLKVADNGQPVNTVNDAAVAVDAKTGSKNLSATTGLVYTVQIGVYRNAVTAGQLYNVSPIYSEVLPNGLIRYTSGLYKQEQEAIVSKNKIVAKGISDAFVIAFNNGKRVSLPQARTLNGGGANISEPLNNSNVPVQNPVNINTPANNNTQPANVPNNSPAENVSKTSENDASAVNPQTVVVVPDIMPPANNGPVKANKTNESDALHKFNAVSDSGLVYKVQIGAFMQEVPNDIAILYLKVSSKGVNHYTDETGLTHYTLGKVKTYAEANELKQYAINEGIDKPFIVAYQDGKKIEVDVAKTLEKP